MIDLQALFPPPQRSFFATLLAVRGEAQRNYACGIAGEPTHWLFNIAALNKAHYDIETSAHIFRQFTNPCAGDEFGVELMGLPIKLDDRDFNLLPRFEICTRPWPGPNQKD